MDLHDQVGGDERIAPKLREFEARVKGISELSELSIAVIQRATFDDLSTSNYVRESEAVYQRSTRTLLLNTSGFVALGPEEQLAVVAHEVGHAHLHAQGSNLGNRECIEADLLACRWGFAEALAGNRERRYGKQYANLLRSWTPETESAVREGLHRVLDDRLMALATGQQGQV